MSLKNDRWIRYMNERYDLISPFVTTQQGGGIISYGPSSFGYDVRAGYDWKIFTDVLGAVVDPKNIDERAYHNIRLNQENPSPIILPPNSYALTHTIEYFKLPRNITCVCIGKSTYARCAVHVNVTPLEAGWEGQVTVEISNGSRLPVKIYPGEGIMQVLFFEGEDPSTSYADRKGKYQNQIGITLAKVLADDNEEEETAFSKLQRRLEELRREKALAQASRKTARRTEKVEKRPARPRAR